MLFCLFSVDREKFKIVHIILVRTYTVVCVV